MGLYPITVSAIRGGVMHVLVAFGDDGHAFLHGNVCRASRISIRRLTMAMPTASSVQTFMGVLLTRRLTIPYSATIRLLCRLVRLVVRLLFLYCGRLKDASD